MFLWDGGFGDGRCHKILAVCNPQECNPNTNIPAGQNNACNPGMNPCDCPTSGPADSPIDTPARRKPTSGRGDIKFIDNTR